MLIEQPASKARASILRKALLCTPLALAFIVVAAIALYNTITSSMGASVGTLVFGIPGIALGLEAWSAIRDLRAEPVTTRGVIVRMWNKGTVLWMTRAYYLLVAVRSDKPNNDQRFFVIPQEAYLQLEDGRSIEVHHWPHTNTVVWLSVIESARAARAPRSTG